MLIIFAKRSLLNVWRVSEYLKFDGPLQSGNLKRSFLKIQMIDTSSHNKWQRVVQRATTNGNKWCSEWQRVLQGVTTNNNEWQQVTANGHFGQFFFSRVRQESTPKHPKENSWRGLWRGTITLRAKKAPKKKYQQ